jgi:hypothetical protein
MIEKLGKVDDPASRIWFLSMLVKNKKTEYEEPLKNAFDELEKKM